MIRLKTSEERITFTLYIRQLNRVFDNLTRLYNARVELANTPNYGDNESQIKYYQDEKHVLQELIRDCLVHAENVKTDKEKGTL